MRLFYARLPYEEKGDACTRGASRIRSPCPKFLGPALSLAKLSNFLKPSCSLSVFYRRSRRHLPSLIPASEHAIVLSLTLKLTAASSLTSSAAPLLTSASRLPRLCYRGSPLALDTTACPPIASPSPRWCRLLVRLSLEGLPMPPNYSYWLLCQFQNAFRMCLIEPCAAIITFFRNLDQFEYRNQFRNRVSMPPLSLLLSYLTI
jgi:hypothetical protein